MAKDVTLQTKYSTTPAATPPAGSMVVGELAVNVADQKLFAGDSNGNPVVIGGGDGGGGVDTHNDLNGRTVADCHPLTSIYDADSTDTPKKNLADILDETVEEAPNDNKAYARMNLGWAEIDLTIPAATWGSITGNISAQTDLYSTFAAKSSSNTISGVWTFSAWNGYNYGLKVGPSGQGYMGATSAPAWGAGTSGTRYVTVTPDNTSLVSCSKVLGVTCSGSVIQPAMLSADQIQFVTNQQLGAALRQLAAAPPPAVVARMSNDPADAFAAMIGALADIVETTDYGHPDHDAIAQRNAAAIAGLNKP